MHRYSRPISVPSHPGSRGSRFASSNRSGFAQHLGVPERDRRFNDVAERGSINRGKFTLRDTSAHRAAESSRGTRRKRPMAEKKYLTAEEVAERGEISPGTLRNWRAMRIGPAFVKLGKSVLYPVEELDAWDKKNMVACRASPGKSVRRYTTFPIV